MVLTPRTIEALALALRRKHNDATVFAIEAKAPWVGPDEIAVGDRRARVREARSPLRLREVLHEDRGGLDLVILTDLDHASFGRANLAKVALRRIEPVQPWPVVRLLFGVASIDARLVRHPWLAERLLQAAPAERNIAGGTLDLETAWSIVLSGFGLRSVRPSDDEFIDAASRPGFTQAFRDLPPEGREEFKRIVQDALDRLGTTLLAVVERGCGEQLLAAGLVAQCLFEVHESYALSVRGAFGERFGVRGIDGAVAMRWGAAVRRLLARSDMSGAAARVRAQADALLVSDLGGMELAHASHELPSGLKQRVMIAAALVERAVAEPITESLLAELHGAVSQVEQHAMAQTHGDADRVAMAARLIRWIASDRPEPASLEAAVRRYADEDCWVDRARIAVKDGESLPEARIAYQALATRVAAERAKLNTIVGAAAITAALPSGGLIGVEHVLGSVVAPLASQRQVALLVMDGMSHAVALDIVRSLEEAGWARYRPSGHAAQPLVVSTIPTVTEYARTSLLCGALRAGGQREEKDGFAAFMRANSLGGGRTDEVMHKDKLDAGPSEVERAIASDAKVVACVVNAIDAQLGGSDQLRAQWSLRTIPVLGRIVRACELSGRAIVLVSDHGHLVDEATEQLSGSGAGTLQPGARWRASDGEIRPGELAARGPRVLAPGGNCVVAADERVRYGNRHAGYHGGVTVQELACPLHVLVHTSTDADLREWLPIETAAPRWWRPDGVAAVARPAVAPPRSRRPAGTAVAPTGGGLFAAPESGWIDALFASEVYKQQRKLAGRAPLPDDYARRIVELFVEQGSAGADSIKITEQALAVRLELSVGDTRRRITLLRNLLNVDGYEVLAQADRDSLSLDLALLKTQFGIGGSTP